jgi:hypothetical protein
VGYIGSAPMELAAYRDVRRQLVVSHHGVWG